MRNYFYGYASSHRNILGQDLDESKNLSINKKPKKDELKEFYFDMSRNRLRGISDKYFRGHFTLDHKQEIYNVVHSDSNEQELVLAINLKKEEALDKIEGLSSKDKDLLMDAARNITTRDINSYENDGFEQSIQESTKFIEDSDKIDIVTKYILKECLDPKKVRDKTGAYNVYSNDFAKMYWLMTETNTYTVDEVIEIYLHTIMLRDNLQMRVKRDLFYDEEFKKGLEGKMKSISKKRKNDLYIESINERNEKANELIHNYVKVYYISTDNSKSLPVYTNGYTILKYLNNILDSYIREYETSKKNNK